MRIQARINRDGRVRKMNEQGCTPAQIAIRLGVSRANATNIMSRLFGTSGPRGRFGFEPGLCAGQGIIKRIHHEGLGD